MWHDIVIIVYTHYVYKTCPNLFLLCPFINDLGKIKIFWNLKVKFSAFFLVVGESDLGVENWRSSDVNTMTWTAPPRNTVDYSFRRSTILVCQSPNISQINGFDRRIYSEQPHSNHVREDACWGAGWLCWRSRRIALPVLFFSRTIGVFQLLIRFKTILWLFILFYSKLRGPHCRHV